MLNASTSPGSQEWQRGPTSMDSVARARHVALEATSPRARGPGFVSTATLSVRSSAARACSLRACPGDAEGHRSPRRGPARCCRRKPHALSPWPPPGPAMNSLARSCASEAITSSPSEEAAVLPALRRYSLRDRDAIPRAGAVRTARGLALRSASAYHFILHIWHTRETVQVGQRLASISFVRSGSRRMSSFLPSRRALGRFLHLATAA